MTSHVPIQPINLNGLKYQKPWFRYVGNPNCSYLELGLYQAIDLIAEITYHEFPDRPDRCLYAGDACCLNGDCTGHPYGSHRGSTKLDKYHDQGALIGHRSIDFNYYTLVGYDGQHNHGNRTQYRPKGERWTQMWEQLHQTDSSQMKLKPKMFDAERNAFFYFHLRKLLSHGGTRFGANDILGDLMFNTLPYKDKMFLNINFGLDSAMTYHHHTHVHANLRYKRV